MILMSMVNGVYKATYNLGAPHCRAIHGYHGPNSKAPGLQGLHPISLEGKTSWPAGRPYAILGSVRSIGTCAANSTKVSRVMTFNSYKWDYIIPKDLILYYIHQKIIR